MCFFKKLYFITVIIMPLLVSADAKLTGIFSDGMVLQRDIEIPVWGWASPDEKIDITLGKQTIQTKADKDGNWLVRFSPLKASLEPIELTVRANNAVERKNILIGDVWICSGQSNMAMTVGNSMNSKIETENAKYPLIRMLRIPKVSSFSPRNDFDRQLAGGWKECSPETVPGFSAVGYFYGRELFKELNIPIGLILSAWSGTPAIAWTSPGSAAKSKDIVEAYDNYRQYKEKELGLRLEYDSDKMKEIMEVRAESGEADKDFLKKFRGVSQEVYGRIPSNLYNGMIAPLIPFGIRGVIWYQGEEDVCRAYRYREVFRNLIRDWRMNWGQGDFPFYFVQLANWNSNAAFSFAELRESQATVLDEPNTGMAVAIDLGDPVDIHPKNKQEVGRRLSLISLAKTYGKKIVFSGPVLDSVRLADNKIIVKFKNAEGGLVCKGDKIKGFAIAGENPEYMEAERTRGSKNMIKIPVFQPAEAQIQGDEIILWNENVKKPFAVRYGWDNSPECNLYNKSDLPALPFRTDNWEGIWR